MSRVLVVDDDAQLLRALRITLRAAGHEVVTAPDGTTALREAAAAHPDVVVLDLGLPTSTAPRCWPACGPGSPARCWCSRHARTAATRSTPSTPAPTTT